MVLQLLAATEKTGELEVRGDDGQRGFLGVSAGRLVSARYDDEDGYLALGAISGILSGGFEFLPQDAVDRRDLTGDLEALLERAAVERERVASIREVVPSERTRFRLSQRATERGEITLAPQQWRALLLVDGRRDVTALARELGMPLLAAQQMLASLVRAGLVDAVPADEGGDADGAAGPYRRLPPMQPIPPTQLGEQVDLRGRIADFPLETVIQLLAETKKTGRIEVRSGREAATLGISDGQLTSAAWGEEEGELALGAAFTIQDGEFEFVPMDEAPAQDLSGDLDALLDRAAETRDRIVAVRSVITDERSRFTLSERATRNPEIVLTPEQWRVLLGVNGERDVDGITDHLRMRRLPAMIVLAELVRGGYVDVIPPAEPVWPAVERRRAPWPPPPPPVVAEPEPVMEEPVMEEAVMEEAVIEEAVEEEQPLAETPFDVAPEDEGPFTAIETVAGPAEPVAPPETWGPLTAEPTPEAELAAQTAEAFAAAPEPEIDPRLAAFGAPPGAEPEPVASWEPAPQWEAPAPAPVEEPEAEPEVDPRLAAFGAPPAAEPEPVASWEPAPQWEPPAPAPVEEPRIEHVPPPAPPPPPPVTPAYVPPPAPVEEKKKGGLFAGLFGGAAKTVPAAAPPLPRAATRSGQLATFANELVAAYNSGQYGKGRVEDRMISLLMRADEQADPIDRPLPVANDRLDVRAIDANGVPERQALPYLAVLVRQIYEEAERAHGKDKARRGFRDVRDRVFGKDLAVLHAAEVAPRLPKV